MGFRKAPPQVIRWLSKRLLLLFPLLPFFLLLLPLRKIPSLLRNIAQGFVGIIAPIGYADMKATVFA